MDFHEKKWEHECFNGDNWQPGHYEKCQFVECSWQLALAGTTFVEVEFVGCDLSASKLQNCRFVDVIFRDCKLSGLSFAECRGVGNSFSFYECKLAYANFSYLDLRKTVFESCELLEVDFQHSNLTDASFVECDLQGSIFHKTKLIRTDFREAFYFDIDPEQNTLRKTKLSILGLDGLLRKYDLDIE